MRKMWWWKKANTLSLATLFSQVFNSQPRKSALKWGQNSIAWEGPGGSNAVTRLISKKLKATVTASRWGLLAGFVRPVLWVLGVYLQDNRLSGTAA